MRNVILSLGAVGGLLAGLNAHALHSFSCSNADGSVNITESEVWGANPVGCFYNGAGVADATVNLDQAFETVIQFTGDEASRDWRKIFAIKAKMSVEKGALGKTQDGTPITSVETYLICDETSTSAQDLAPPVPPCKIEFSPAPATDSGPSSEFK